MRSTHIAFVAPGFDAVCRTYALPVNVVPEGTVSVW